MQEIPYRGYNKLNLYQLYSRVKTLLDTIATKGSALPNDTPTNWKEIGAIMVRGWEIIERFLNLNIPHIRGMVTLFCHPQSLD